MYVKCVAKMPDTKKGCVESTAAWYPASLVAANQTVICTEASAGAP